jgi:hypothetical protein
VFLGWTFNTHRGGEEQALFGMLDRLYVNTTGEA